MKLLEENKKNLLSIILSAIGTSFFISLLTNIIFTELYMKWKCAFILISCISMVVIFYFLCQIMYRMERKVIKVKYQAIYDYKKKCFIDLPYSPTSVNARVLFYNLSGKQKARLNSEEERWSFVNSFVVQFLFSLVFNNSACCSSIEKWIRVDRKYLQEILVNYEYIDVDRIVGKEDGESAVVLPKGFRIKSVKEDSISISTKQGFITFSWDICSQIPCQDELLFLAQMKDVDISNCCAYNIEVTLEYGYKPVKLFWNSTKELDNYLEYCVEELKECDINTIIEKVKIIYMTEVIKKLGINTYKESLRVIEESEKKK